MEFKLGNIKFGRLSYFSGFTLILNKAITAYQFNKLKYITWCCVHSIVKLRDLNECNFEEDFIIMDKIICIIIITIVNINGWLLFDSYAHLLRFHSLLLLK